MLKLADTKAVQDWKGNAEVRMAFSHNYQVSIFKFNPGTYVIKSRVKTGSANDSDVSPVNHCQCQTNGPMLPCLCQVCFGLWHSTALGCHFSRKRSISCHHLKFQLEHWQLKSLLASHPIDQDLYSRSL